MLKPGDFTDEGGRPAIVLGHNNTIPMDDGSTIEVYRVAYLDGLPTSDFHGILTPAPAAPAPSTTTTTTPAA